MRKKRTKNIRIISSIPYEIIVKPVTPEIKNIAYPKTIPAPMSAWRKLTRFIASFFNI